MTLDERPGISGLTTEELSAWLVERGEPAYRARQIGDAVWRGDARTAADIRTLPAPLREALDAAFSFDTVADTEVREADGGLTEKSLHRLADGALIESVLMHYPARPGSRERHTLCISSQAGCAVGCPFCATGELGFGRDLEVAEIVDQVRSASRRLVAAGQRLTNIVFMGMGEPLLNLDRVLAAIEALNDRRRFGLGARHITVSTSGVVPGIRRLTALGPQFTLAVSLHAARDPLRDVLVPLNRRWPVAEVIAAARDHAAATGRRISYEVTMIGGVNDTELDATAMAELLRGDHAHVNLIPMLVSRCPAATRRRDGEPDLVDDLGHLEVAPEAELAGRAERAADRAAGLARDAQRMPLARTGPRRVVHQDQFDERAVGKPVERLLGQAAVRVLQLGIGDGVEREGRG